MSRTVAVFADQLSFLEDLEVLRHRRAANRHPARQFTYGQGFVTQQIEKRATGRVRKHGKRRSVAGRLMILVSHD